jgi:hypothetical protein
MPQRKTTVEPRPARENADKRQRKEAARDLVALYAEKLSREHVDPRVLEDSFFAWLLEFSEKALRRYIDATAKANLQPEQRYGYLRELVREHRRALARAKAKRASRLMALMLALLWVPDWLAW